MNTESIINIIALLVAPILAVIIGRWFQDRNEKRNDKMKVFQAVMTYRYTISMEAVHALNSIPVVFAKNRKVRDCWKTLYEDYCYQGVDDYHAKKKQDDLYKLLESMAEVLGYKKLISWEDIQNPYIPVGMKKTEINNEKINEAMASILQKMTSNNIESSKSTSEKKI